uniref:Uncharacterized protein ALNC14_086640 n=1 Tax=Albugo laibachii Nc14 TaxID=890382 RepID=F0WMI9_9STRA|nr:unnamed protein product [Albugo laibachii Nc14]|eukprot:CCA22521.1 unnamed protein product [Albugo laibachii Nc14]
MVRYKSTRGEVHGLSFEEAVLTGLASDRGLLVPEKDDFPSLPSDAHTLWMDLSYREIAFKVMRLFIDPQEMSNTHLQDIIDQSYMTPTFRELEITPIKQITSQLYVLELFHGPTFAFKDIALQFLGKLFEYFLKRKNEILQKAGEETYTVTVVGATSGDTGSSAIHSVRGKENIRAFIMFPEGRVSAIQERQMTTVLDKNIHNIAVKGTFDDCQSIVKKLFSDSKFKEKYHLGAVNSINWARILAQMVYYVYAYFQLKKQGVDRVTFSVPTGNFGDILAGFYARKLGLPIELIVATNENDILYRFFKDGKYHRFPIIHTNTPSMDICVSSNFERYLFALCDEDANILAHWMHHFEQTGQLTLTGPLLARAQREMKAYAVRESTVCETIAQYHEKQSYLFDPHTAVAVNAAELHLAEIDTGTSGKSAVIVVGTAHYGKFLPTVCGALQVSEEAIEQHPILKSLETMPTSMTVLENSCQAVKEFIEKSSCEETSVQSRVRSVVKRMQRHVVGVAHSSEMSVVPLAIGVVAIGCVIGRKINTVFITNLQLVIQSQSVKEAMHIQSLLIAASKRIRSNRRAIRPLLLQCPNLHCPTTHASFTQEKQLHYHSFSTNSTSKSNQENDQKPAIPGVTSPGEKFVMLYTCKVCETRSAKTLSKHAYFHGVVLVRCPHCENLHLIADRLGWFEEESTDIESILKAKGEHVKIVTTDNIMELTNITAA